MTPDAKRRLGSPPLDGAEHLQTTRKGGAWPPLVGLSAWPSSAPCGAVAAYHPRPCGTCSARGPVRERAAYSYRQHSLSLLSTSSAGLVSPSNRVGVCLQQRTLNGQSTLSGNN